MPSSDRPKSGLRLDPRVTTDVAILADRVALARLSPSTEAIELLRSGLDLVDGPPFNGAGYDWAHRELDVAEASMLIEQAVDQLVAHALEAGRYDLAREAAIQGLKGLPGDEQFYRTRMRIEAEAANAAGIKAVYDELLVHLLDFDAEPSPVTIALYRDLIARRNEP